MKLHSHIAAILTIASFAAGAGQTFKMDEKSYVPFDATTKVTVECPDSAAAGWLTAHLTEGMILPTLSITDAPLYDRQVNSNFGEVKP